MEANGEAIYGSRPWTMAESETANGTPLRFTLSGDGVYCLVMGTPAGRRVVLPTIDGSRVSRYARWRPGSRQWSEENGALVVTLPDRLPVSAVTAWTSVRGWGPLGDRGSDVRTLYALGKLRSQHGLGKAMQRVAPS